jgi:hypothetical protein
VLSAVAVISIKRGGGTVTISDVQERLRLGSIMAAVVAQVEAAQAAAGEDAEADPTPAVDEAA